MFRSLHVFDQKTFWLYTWENEKFAFLDEFYLFCSGFVQLDKLAEFI